MVGSDLPVQRASIWMGKFTKILLTTLVAYNRGSAKHCRWLLNSCLLRWFPCLRSFKELVQKGTWWTSKKIRSGQVPNQSVEIIYWAWRNHWLLRISSRFWYCVKHHWKKTRNDVSMWTGVWIEMSLLNTWCFGKNVIHGMNCSWR